MTSVTKANGNTYRRVIGYFMAVIAVCGTICLAPGQLAAKTEPELRTIKLEIRDGKVTAPQKTFRVNEGEKIKLSWSTDRAVELHLHGYDILALAKPGRITHMTFVAKIAGRFPISAHEFGHGALVYLEVYPR